MLDRRIATLAIFLLLACIPAAQAQTNPTMPSQARDTQKDVRYSEFYEHKKMPSADEQRIAYELGKDYLRLYGGDEGDPDVRSVRKFVREYEKIHGQSQLDAAMRAKNYPQAFQIGRGLLKTDPEAFYVLATLSQAGYENALAGNATLNEETIGYLRHSIQLLEGGKVSKPDLFTTLEVAKGFLNFTLGWFLKDQSPEEAAAEFRKAAISDSPYHANGEVYYRLGAAILKGEFARLSAEYNTKFGNKPPSPEQMAMLEQIRNVAERIIDAYARAVALSRAPEQQEARTKILTQLTAIHRSFHGEADAELKALIANVLSKPLP